MASSLNILLLFTYNLSLRYWDKIGIFEREVLLYKKLTNKNLKYVFLTYGDKSDLSYSLNDNIKILPVKNLIKSNNPVLRFLKSIILPLKLSNELKRIDIIKTNQLEGSWVSYLAKIIFKKKLIIRGGYEQFRNYISSSQLKKNQRYSNYLLGYIKFYLLEFIAYKIADAIILTSSSDIKFISDVFRLKRQQNKIYHLPNFIDINLFKPLDLEKKEKSVLFIGRLHPEKNLTNLIKALGKLDGFTLTIIGGGNYESYLMKWGEKYNSRINYLGIIPNNQLPKIINQHQIFVLPSYYEGTPKVLLEAMSCGLTCIGTNVRGINNIIEHKENGYLCNTDPISIKDAILNLYKNKELRANISKAAREYVVRNCSLDTIAQKEYLIYKNLLE